MTPKDGLHRMNVDIPISLHEKLRVRAASEERTLRSIVMEALVEHLSGSTLIFSSILYNSPVWVATRLCSPQGAGVSGSGYLKVYPNRSRTR